ncbi:MAG: hypothetical protein M0R70_04890 [Nitrospirae bacterium]|nr:hypothetical protein [Nitrospirota bacterium]
MRKYILVAIVAALAGSGCSSVVAKNFKVFADPPDATIRVVSGVELKEQRYRPPATITAGVPKDPALAAKAFLEVSKDNYRQKTILLRDINEGDTLNIKLEKILHDLVRYKLSYRLISPVVSQELRFRDKNISVSFAVGEHGFEMQFENLSPYDVKILWDRAEYTDMSGQTQRLMHSGVRFPDRNNPIPDQFVLSRSSVQETVIPISNVYVLPQRKGYDIRPLFPVESDVAAGLKGKKVILFIPVEINRQIIPYNFKIEITNSVKEIIKE